MDQFNRDLVGNELISRSTISPRLRENGLHGRVAVKKPLLSKTNKMNLLKFAKEHRLDGRSVDEGTLDR